MRSRPPSPPPPRRFARKMASEEQEQKFHSDDLSQIGAVLFIGIARATREMCFNQSEALP